MPVSPDIDEEEWLSNVRPHSLGKGTLVAGGLIVAHFAFYPQRSLLDQTDILAQYKKYGFSVNL